MCLKSTIIFSTIFLFVSGVTSVVLGVAASYVDIFPIMGYLTDTNLTMYFLYGGIGAAVYMLLMIVVIACVGVKKKALGGRLLLAFLSFAGVAFYLTFTVGLIITFYQSEVLINNLGSDQITDYSFQKALNQLYAKADSILCVSSNGGQCQIAHTISSPQRTYFTSANGILSTQLGTSHLSAAYRDYTVKFDSQGDLIDYLNRFGTIEKDYDCSGIGSKKDIYYFSNTKAGAPKSSGKSKIISEVIKFPLYFYISCSLMSTILLLSINGMQYGLFGRGRKRKMGYYGTKVKNFSVEDSISEERK